MTMSQADYILGARTCTGISFIRNEDKLCSSTWDHYLVRATMHDAEGQVLISNSKKETRMVSLEADQQDEKAKFKNKVMGADGTETEKKLLISTDRLRWRPKPINSHETQGEKKTLEEVGGAKD